MVSDLGDAMSATLESEFDYYLAHKEELVKKYSGRVIALKDGEVLGVYDSELDALTALQNAHELGTFLIQRVLEGDAAVTQTFYSPAVFS